MIFKLSLKNLKAHVPNYLVYYISMTFAAVVYYCFRAIAYNQPLVAGAGRDIEIKRSLGLGSTLVTIIILGFMLAANRFFIGKRSQEIGLYRLIGLRKSQVSLIFLVENLVLGFVSLINGIILGVIFTKLFSMILAKVMFLEVPSFFYISWRSVIETGVAFAFMILIVCLRSIWMIYRYPLSQLMHQEKIGQINYSRLTKRRQFLGILGPICLLAGYFIAFDFRNLATGIVYKQLNDSLFVAILALFITGSILMLRQLFSAVSERQDYVTLKRMGVSSKAITKQIYRQNSLIFFPPMVIGILHTTFAIYLLSQFIKSPGYLLVYLSCGILIIVYLIFYILTSAIYARMIRHIHF
ncbi:hypothetical protein WOQ_02109 [Enterococcus faecalis EnGen0340]|uniref:ABC transporter permease n=1 Tax=Enterococcus faecalis TaxID=1351 RepID=UPI000330D487|nr:ABC transporter permease [Enterococcus faecalis]EOJ97399.1 hypothetical protein WOQ_02109 [Enterococcus faecalis EnGen0340]